MIDTNHSLAYWTTNVNIFEFHWQVYGHALWYDATIETYEQAMERVKKIVNDKIKADNPHLIDYTEHPKAEVSSQRFTHINDASKPTLQDMMFKGLNSVPTTIIENKKLFEQRIEEFTGTPTEFEQQYGYLTQFEKYKEPYNKKFAELSK